MTEDSNFSRAVALEAAHPREAAAIYASILDEDPGHAAALVNLGTVHHRLGEYGEAELFYRRAVAAEPEYALAWFDLANTLEETGRRPEAVVAYNKAIRITSGKYADAWYNLALSLESLGRPREALAAWAAYARLDPASSFAAHARARIKLLLREEGMKVVRK